MTKDKALYAWFNGFGIPFYPTTSVPEDSIFPWGTYELVTSAWEDGDVSITVNLWYRTESEAVPNAKAAELSKAIGPGGVLIPCDEGYVRIMRGNPWCQCLADEADAKIKRRYINMTARYYTEN